MTSSDKSFEGLPNDLLIQIIDWVGTDVWSGGFIAGRGSKALYSLMQCSRHLNKLCIPKLYSTFRQERSLATNQFLLQILKKPELGAMVKKYSGASQEPGDMLDDNSTEMEVHRQALRKFDIHGTESPIWLAWLTMSREQRLDWVFDEANTQGMFDWLFALQHQQWDALTAFLLMQLPNLQEIEITSYDGGKNPPRFIIYVLNYAWITQRRRPAGFLDHVKRISIAHFDSEGGLDLEDLIPFLQLRSVETAYFHMVSENEEFEVSNYSANPFTNIKSLSFNCSNIEWTKLRDFVTLCPNLSHFYYTCGGSTIGSLDFLPQKFPNIFVYLKGQIGEIRTPR